MKTITIYIACSSLVVTGAALLTSDDVTATIVGAALLFACYLSSKQKTLKKYWKRYLKTNLEIIEYFEAKGERD